MRTEDVKRGVRVRVLANTAGGRKQNAIGQLVWGDTIVLDRLQGTRAIYKLDNDPSHENYMNLKDLELIEPRVKKPVPVDVWEAARGYIRN